MNDFPTPSGNSRFGFHYYPDSLHYRESDLQTWLPELKDLGAQWLTLVAHPDRSIPEKFITGLVKEEIEPVIHFHLSPQNPPEDYELSILLDSYADWGVNYISFYKRPNCRDEWGGGEWAQQNLVERFLDRFIPLANAAVEREMHPIFPPLQPGGDYWDTAFLRSSLEGLKNRDCTQILEKLVIGAYGWASNLPLNWGAGGPERWSGARPYFTPDGEEDQIGFRIFDWYSTISQAVLNKPLPIILLAGGSRLRDQLSGSRPEVDLVAHTDRNFELAHYMAGELTSSEGSEGFELVPPNVLTCNFWLLAADADSEYSSDAYFKADGNRLPVVELLKSQPPVRNSTAPELPNISAPILKKKTVKSSSDLLIQHYLLLPAYEWGIADWHLEVIRPFIKQHMPTIGFSLEEAKYAHKVTIVGGSSSFSSADVELLKSSGCEVHQISGDGISIATQLETI